MSPSRIPRQSPAAVDRPVHLAAARVAALYAVYAAAWIVFSDLVLAQLGLPSGLEQFVNSTKGLAFVLVTALALYAVIRMHLARLRQAESELHEQESRIRQAYVDVLDAVTGGRLVLVTETELDAMLGDQILGPVTIDDPSMLAAARRDIRSAITPIEPVLADSTGVMNAAGEALNNALKHAGVGKYGVCESPDMVQIRVDDEGPGIDFRTLPRATLLSGFSTASTMGLGFTLMLQLSDRLLLVTRPGRTTVVLEFYRDTKRSTSVHL